MNRTFRLLVSVFTMVFIISSVVFGVFAAQKLSELSLGDEVYIQGLEEESKEYGIINMLLVGVDDGGFRSDTIMLVSVDSYSDRINLLSIPRDTMVKAKGYTVQKINALIGLGKQAVINKKLDEPEELLIDMVKELTGLPVHYFATIDFDGFIEVIDAVDGVDFNVPYNMNYDDPVQGLHIHLKAGQQRLDGQAAHDFMRFRQNNSGGAPGEYVLGDEGREYWQQEFIKELIRQKCRPQYIKNLDDIFDVISRSVRTNYTMKDLLGHIDLMQSVDLSEIGSHQLPGHTEYIDGVWWYKCNKEETRKLINEVFLPKSKTEWEEYKQTKEETSGFESIDAIHNATN